MNAIPLVPFAVILGLSAWGLRRVRAARRDILAALTRQQHDVLRMDRRYVRLGPFAGTTSRSQIVYRLETRLAAGDRRVVWARWGRDWPTRPDTLELKWEG